MEPKTAPASGRPVWKKIAIVSVSVLVVAAIAVAVYFFVVRNRATEEQLRAKYYQEQAALMAPAVNEFMRSSKEHPAPAPTEADKKAVADFIKQQKPAEITAEQKAQVEQFMKESAQAQEEAYQAWKKAQSAK